MATPIAKFVVNEPVGNRFSLHGHENTRRRGMSRNHGATVGHDRTVLPL
ncbi:MAG TPA: hypothetical protein VMX38_09640 [Verrucomicrobiae bacterium]|nr:hypothetical protein [Verrucomicrobiae bacterium]